jgi:hypothetical protein
MDHGKGKKILRQTDCSISEQLCLRFDNSWFFEAVSSCHGGMEATANINNGLAIQSDFDDVSLDADFCNVTQHFQSMLCCDIPATWINVRGINDKEQNSREVAGKLLRETSSKVGDYSPDAIFLFELQDLPDPADGYNEHCFEDVQPDFDELI